MAESGRRGALLENSNKILGLVISGMDRSGAPARIANGKWLDDPETPPILSG